MSALNCFLTPDAAHLYTDGVLYDGVSRNVQGIACKAMPLPHLNAVIAVTGFYWASIMLASAMSEWTFRDFDETADNFASALKEYVDKSKDIPSFPKSWGNFVAGLAGWSTSADAPAFVSVRNFDQPEAGAYETLRSTQYISPAREHDFDRDIIDLKFNVSDPEGSGLAIMRMQRKKRFVSQLDPNDHRTHRAIGGFCQQTTVTRDGISIKVLERWPDAIGQPIRN